MLLPVLAAKGYAKIMTVQIRGEARASLLLFLVNAHGCAYLSGRDPTYGPALASGCWHRGHGMQSSLDVES